MKKFFFCYNNGVSAMVSEQTLADLKRKDDIRQVLNHEDYKKSLSEGLRHLGVPIFTFVRDERYEKSPWFTGDNNLYALLFNYLRKRGDRIDDNFFFVPFSNGCELGIRGEQAMTSELSYVTTEQQFIDAFGISPIELLAQ